MNALTIIALQYYLSSSWYIWFGWLLPKQYSFDPFSWWFTHCDAKICNRKRWYQSPNGSHDYYFISYFYKDARNSFKKI